MSRPTLQDIEQLITGLVMPFYHVQRDMLVLPEMTRTENDAEHSWSLALIACALADKIAPRLDLGLISQFAIVHDLVEVYAGDTTPWDDDDLLHSKETREAKAFERLKVKYGTFPWIIQRIQEYESKSSEEARFVWSADKLIALYIRYLDHGQFYISSGITRTRFVAGMVEHRRKANAHPAVAEYY